MKKIVLLTVILFCVIMYASAQEANPMLVGIMQHQLKELKESPPAEENDDVLTRAQAFIPPDGKYDIGPALDSYVDSVKQNTRVSTGGAFLYETENGQVRVDYMEINTDWMNIPCWRDAYVLITISSVTTSKGQEVILPKERYDEYAEKGYFDNEHSFGPAYGSSEIKTYLDREPVRDDYPFTLKGEMLVSWPVAYKAITFMASDTGKVFVAGDYKIKLLSMEKNTVVYTVSGPMGFSDRYKTLCTNKDGKPFVSQHGSSMSYDFYMEAKKNNFEISDKRLQELAAAVEKEALSNVNTEQLYVEKVPGTFYAITFYSVTNTAERVFPLKLNAGE